MREGFRAAYRHLMSGVSYFLPFVVAGGMLLSFAFLFDAGNSGSADFGSGNPVSAWLLQIGGYAFQFMLPVLAAYIAFSIADRPALLPGFMAGLLARDGNAGFIGAILGAVAAGYIMVLLKKATASWARSFNGTKNLIVFPVIGTVLAALVMIPINWVVQPINTGLTDMLSALSGTSAVLIGAVVGGMLAVDMGGPVNKTAYLFAVASLTDSSGASTGSVIMASAACSGMTISTSCALASTIFRKRFSEDLRDAGKAAYVMGASYIAEGAIPFVIAKPRAILPSIVCGAALAGALAGLFGITIAAPIGGIFTLPLASNIPLYILSFLAGTALSTALIGVLLRVTEGPLPEERSVPGAVAVDGAEEAAAPER